MVDAASRSCAGHIQPQIQPSVSTGDGLAALSTAFVYGSLLLAVVALVAAVAWGWVVKGWAEREAKIEAERVAKKWLEDGGVPFIRKWLEDQGVPLLRRELEEFFKTFPEEAPISETEVDAMAAAAGEEGKEDGNGEEK